LDAAGRIRFPVKEETSHHRRNRRRRREGLTAGRTLTDDEKRVLWNVVEDR